MMLALIWKGANEFKNEMTNETARCISGIELISCIETINVASEDSPLD